MWLKNYSLKRSVYRELFESDPINVQYDTDREFTSDERGCGGIREAEIQCYNEFWYFASWINKLYEKLQEPIRLQELRDPLLRGSAAMDGPAFGRRYDIYYNRRKIGYLEVCASLIPRYERDGSVHVEIDLSHIPPRVLPFEDVYGFLSVVASLVVSVEKQSPRFANTTEYQDALLQIDRAMLGAVWQITEETSEIGRSLEITFSGRPDHYRELAHVQDQGRGDPKT